ncbi:DUF418 domain-containing protein [Paenibacillus elgii]|nr:DUF418 domain-containing protein [Paenibacillus elgii]
MNLLPIQKAERVQLLDICRGFAILGIFLVNVPSMLGMQPVEGVRVYEGFDSTLKLGFDLLLTTKFYSIFALLFGAGFWIFMSRAESHGKNARTVYLRRSLVLLGFGVLHGVLFWEGDVLQFYAVHGLALLLFYKRRPRTILIWAAALMIIFWIIVGVVNFVISPAETIVTAPEPYNAIRDYARSFQERVTVQLPLKWATTVIFLLDTLPLFLFGLCLAKTGLLLRLDTWKGKLPRLQWMAVLAAALLSIPIVISYMTKQFYTGSSIMLFVMMQGKAVMLFYLVTIARIHTSPRFKPWLSPLSYAGRMALSNYVMHTVVTVIGVALVVENTAALKLWQIVLYCLGVYGLQIVLSRMWLSCFPQGPLEWLWRKGTYGLKPVSKAGASVSR